MFTIYKIEIKQFRKYIFNKNKNKNKENSSLIYLIRI